MTVIVVVGFVQFAVTLLATIAIRFYVLFGVMLDYLQSADDGLDTGTLVGVLHLMIFICMCIGVAEMGFLVFKIIGVVLGCKSKDEKNSYCSSCMSCLGTCIGGLAPIAEFVGACWLAHLWDEGELLDGNEEKVTHWIVLSFFCSAGALLLSGILLGVALVIHSFKDKKDREETARQAHFAGYGLGMVGLGASNTRAVDVIIV